MNQKVLVTGVSGFVGQHCAAELLKKGYKVKGSVRSLSKEQEVRTGLAKAVDAKDNLEFCELNLSKDDGWEEAMSDCDFVLHVASPYFVKEPKDENEMIKPAVEGTLRALKSAKKAGVKRVVVTSSLVAMMGGKEGIVKLDENSWTDVKAKNVSAYMKSKTEAEKSAWDFIEKQEGEKLELAVVNPGPIYGPTLTGNLNGESMKMFKDLITGKMPMLPKASISMSDVRDIAKVHVLAMETPEASGKRFITTTDKSYAFKDVAEILKTNGYDKVSTKEAPSFLLKLVGKFNSEIKGMVPFIGNDFTSDNSQTKKVLNWSPISLEKTVLDTAKSVEELL
jgi:dihydroflavonol-4-reductase